MNRKPPTWSGLGLGLGIALTLPLPLPLVGCAHHTRHDEPVGVVCVECVVEGHLVRVSARARVRTRVWVTALALGLTQG